ncbi:hypothetical protein HDU77_006427 [Chytriomyces hyalinus]|nr:hypothetical protein HDU77_006427 [Chytriomyces hyalinus]
MIINNKYILYFGTHKQSSARLSVNEQQQQPKSDAYIYSMAPQSCSQYVLNAMNDFYNTCRTDTLYPFKSLSTYYTTPKGMVADCYIWNGISLTLPSPSPSPVKSTSSRSASSTAPTVETSPTLETSSSAEPPSTGPSPTEISNSTQSGAQTSSPTSTSSENGGIVMTRTSTAAAISPSAGSVVADTKSATPASVGVIVGFLMGALVVGLGIFWYVFRKRRKEQPRIWENAFFNGGGHSAQGQDDDNDALIPLYASPTPAPGTSPFVGANAEIARVSTKSSFGERELGPVPRRGDTVLERPVHTPETATLRTATTRTLMSNESVYDDQTIDELSVLPPPIPPVYMMHDTSHIIDAYSEPEEIQILSKEKEAKSLSAPQRNPFDDILSPTATVVSPATAAAKGSRRGMSGISPIDWDVEQVALWALTVDSFGPRVSVSLRSHGVTGEMLFKLTNEQMREDLGLYRLNDRMSFSAAIERLRPTLAEPPSYHP